MTDLCYGCDAPVIRATYGGLYPLIVDPEPDPTGEVAITPLVEGGYAGTRDRATFWLAAAWTRHHEHVCREDTDQGDEPGDDRAEPWQSWFDVGAA